MFLSASMLSLRNFYVVVLVVVSEALILESVNPQYDDRLFIDLRLQYEKKCKFRICCVQRLFWMLKQKTKINLCSELVFFSFWSCKSMNNLLSYCGLTDARMNASEKDLPVLKTFLTVWIWKTRIYRSFLTSDQACMPNLKFKSWMDST